MRRFFCLVFAITVVTPVHAKKPVIEPGAAYVLIDVGDLEDSMMKGVDVPGVITLGRYDPDKQDIKGGDLSPETALPEKASPRLLISKRPVVKAKAMRQYLVRIEPDTWVIEGANGTAFSLGSMMFQIAPGQILDLGVFKPVTDWAEGEKPKSMASGMLGAMLFGSFQQKNQRPNRLDWHARTSDDLPLPAELDGISVIDAVYSPDAKFGNYLGGLVNRIGGRAARFKALRQQMEADSEDEDVAAASDNREGIGGLPADGSIAASEAVSP